MKFRTQITVSGCEIEKFARRDEAEKSIIGEEDCEVAELDENENWLPCSYLDERAMKSAAAAILGKIGGRIKTAKKAAASRENGKKGGRPRKVNNP
jgi:hypothetical protein